MLAVSKKEDREFKNAILNHLQEVVQIITLLSEKSEELSGNRFPSGFVEGLQVSESNLERISLAVMRWQEGEKNVAWEIVKELDF